MAARDAKLACVACGVFADHGPLTYDWDLHVAEPQAERAAKARGHVETKMLATCSPACRKTMGFAERRPRFEKKTISFTEDDL